MHNVVNLYHHQTSAVQDTEARGSRQLHSIRKKVALPTSEGTFLVPWTDILYCRADSNYCWVHRTNGEPILVSKTLKSIAGMLPQGAFARVHQTYLVRLEAVTRVSRDHVIIEATRKIPVSRSKRSALIHSLKSIATF